MRSERGSALLIVFVFAAIVAIMLYRALPDAMFEGQRQKEQLLIDRGSEYKTAIKRFLVRNKTYPTSLDQLDNFNNVRYIRHRFKDPMTGKQEWRMIHIMNPGFILTDSKVKPLNPNQTNAGGFGSNPSAPGGFGSSNTGGFGSASSGGFGSNTGGFGSNNTSTFGNSNTNSSTFGNSSANSNSANNNTTQQAAVDPNAPPAPTAAQLYGAQRRPPAAPNSNIPGGEQPAAGDQLVDKPLADPAPATVASNPAGQANSQNGFGFNNQPNNPATPGASSSPNNSAAAGLDAVNNALRRQGPAPTSAFGSSSNSQSGGITVGAGAIAGVASTAKGSSIKIIDGQTDYSKWEFVYNPQNDAASKMQNSLNNNKGPNANNNSNGNPGGFGGPSNSFNNSGSSNSFGGPGSSFGSSSRSGGFGSSSSGNSTAASPAAPASQ